MYAALQTRPDIAFAVQHLSQYTSNPAQEHWTVVKQVLRYLKGTRNEGIVYKQAETAPWIEIYADADFANRADAKSISGYACVMNGACLAWSSKKQSMVALSTIVLGKFGPRLIGTRSGPDQTQRSQSRPVWDFPKNTGPLGLRSGQFHIA